LRPDDCRLKKVYGNFVVVKIDVMEEDDVTEDLQHGHN